MWISIKICPKCKICRILSYCCYTAIILNIADSCNSRSKWDTKFDACLRTICQHRVSAAMGHCACLWAHWAGLPEISLKSFDSCLVLCLIPGSQLGLTDKIYLLWPLDWRCKSSATDPRQFLKWIYDFSNNVTVLFAVWVLFSFQMHPDGEKSCGSLHLELVSALLYLGSHYLQIAELNVLKGESFLYM